MVKKLLVILIVLLNLNHTVVYGAKRTNIDKVTEDIFLSIRKSEQLEEFLAQDETIKGDSFSSFFNNYLVVGPSGIDESIFPREGGVDYSPLDELGRTQKVVATINYKKIDYSKGKREKWENNSEPSGWFANENQSWNQLLGKVAISLDNGKTYNGYFYNRSHLLADSLGGKAIRENAITGTRQQNVGNNNGKTGMQYIEMKILDYLTNNQDVLAYYMVVPVYHEDDLVPYEVVVYAKTSDGAIDEKVVVSNTASGWNIDYSNGEPSLAY